MYSVHNRLAPMYATRDTSGRHRLVVVCCLLFIIFYFIFLGNEDIVNGNLKLILGLIWSLIVRYQIGRSKFPPKKLMLAWLKVYVTNRIAITLKCSKAYSIIDSRARSYTVGVAGMSRKQFHHRLELRDMSVVLVGLL